jgi:hypothetical protein
VRTDWSFSIEVEGKSTSPSLFVSLLSPSATLSPRLFSHLPCARLPFSCKVIADCRVHYFYFLFFSPLVYGQFPEVAGSGWWSVGDRLIAPLFKGRLKFGYLWTVSIFLKRHI